MDKKTYLNGFEQPVQYSKVPSNDRKPEASRAKRPEYIKCVSCPTGGGIYCDPKDVGPYWKFVDWEHALLTVLQGDRLAFCPDCYQAWLKTGHLIESTVDIVPRDTKTPAKIVPKDTNEDCGHDYGGEKS